MSEQENMRPALVDPVDSEWIEKNLTANSQEQWPSQKILNLCPSRRDIPQYISGAWVWPTYVPSGVRDEVERIRTCSGRKEEAGEGLEVEVQYQRVGLLAQLVRAIGS